MWPGESFSQPFYTEWEIIEEIFNSVSTQLNVECDPQGDSTGLPESLFRGGIYDGFCKEVEKNKGSDVTWVVDHKGKQIPIKDRRDVSELGLPRFPRALRRRSPPVNADDYEGYIIELKWDPTEGGGACPESCEKALLGVSNSQCMSSTTSRLSCSCSSLTIPWCIGGHAGPHQTTMAGKIKYNVLCGEYTVTVKAPENPPPIVHNPPPRPRPRPAQKCWKRDEFGKHAPVNEKQVREGAKSFCKDNKKLSWKNAFGVSSTQAPDGRFGQPSPDSWLTFWADMDTDECDKDTPEFAVSDPEGDTACETLLFNNYKKCRPSSHLSLTFPIIPHSLISISLRCQSIVGSITNKCDLLGINGGTGGFIKAGCITYGFRPYEGSVGHEDIKAREGLS